MNTFKILLIAVAMLFTSIAATASDEDVRVIVGNDTVSMVIPEANYGRYDRGLKNYLFTPKGDWAFGLTASMGEFDADDVQVLSIMKDFDVNGKIYSIKPSASYFFKNNQSIGVRLNYTHANANLAHLAIDFDDDLNFEIKDVTYDYSTYAASIFYRRYIGLGMDKRFALFNEIALNLGGGESRFKRYYNNVLSDTRTDIFEASLNFCPGVCMFIMDNVSVNLSFGVLGLYMRDEKQKTNGIDEGSRFSSGANFKFNLFNVNFGISLHI